MARHCEDPSLSKRGEKIALDDCIMNSMHAYINFPRTVREGDIS